MQKRCRALPIRPTRAAAAGLTLAAAVTLACLAFMAPLSSADVTIGANVNQVTSESGTCGFMTPTERPCSFVTSVIPGQTMTSPCDGTVTRFRLNGFPRPANHYRLRVIRKNADGSFTGTASSAQVSIAAEGVNEYETSLPIATGELIGIDFLDSLEEHGIRWVGGTGVGAAYFYAFPADGGSASPTGPATFYYLVNADISCTAPPSPNPTKTPPSNEFKVVKLKGKALTVNLASAGAVAVTAKQLKRSTASGGPGNVKVSLKLTGTAKKALNKKGKVKVKASITFTPTGGTAATQTRKLTVKKPKPH